MVNTAWQRKEYTNGWTDLKVGGLLLMKDDQDSLRHHAEVAGGVGYCQ